jgi:hypothetical protein
LKRWLKMRRKRKIVGMAGPVIVKPKAGKKITMPLCSSCLRPVELNSLGLLCTGREHPIFHGCGRVLCSGRYCGA